MEGPKFSCSSVLMTNGHSRESNAFSKSIMIITDGMSYCSASSIDVQDPVNAFLYIPPFNETSLIIIDQVGQI